MSGESKFAKLRLPVSKRSKTARSSSSSQISAFFAKSTPSTSIDLDEDSKTSTLDEQATFNSKNEINHQLPSSLPERKISESTSSDSKPLFASFESIKPSKLRRIDPDISTNHSTIKQFFAANGNENDFESPPAKVAKKAITFKKKQRTTTSKRQPKIKNALYKREEIISNFIAEQSMADDVDPNEMQMALALSKSEVETFRIEGDPEASNGSTNSMEAICEKLEEFGYRVGRGNNNHQLYGTSKGKAKWANKFTPLTLRNPEHQQEKVNKKVEEFLNSQCTRPKNFKTVLHKPFEIASSFLSHMKTDNFIHQRHRNYEFYNINKFYVTNIIEPTINKVGNLLRDFHAIPGRDKSPPRVLITEEKKLKIHDEVFDFVPQYKAEDIQTPAYDECTSSEEIHVLTSSNESKNHNICRANSPDLFMEEEEEDISEIKNSVDRLPTIETTPKLINQQLSMDIVTLSSESNSNGILTCEKFSSDEVKTADRTGIWNQDLSYTLKNTNEETEIVEPEKVIDLTQENLVDLTQSDIEADKDDDDVLRNSFRSLKSAGTDLNSSLDSSSSIIVLSDDEVNYSIKAARGLNISGNSTDKTDTESSSLIGKADAGASLDGVDNETEYESPWKKFDSDSHDNYENNLECNNLSQLSNISGVDKLNYSLAHEIMSRSFEEFGKINHIHSVDKNDASSTGDMPFLDLTGPTSPCVSQDKEVSSTKNSSLDIHNEFCDNVDSCISHPITQQPSEDEDFIFQDHNGISSPKYTQLVDDRNNYTSSCEIIKSPLVEFTATLDTKKADPNDDLPCLDLTDSTPPNCEEISYPSTSMHSINDSINTSRKFRKTHSDSFLIPKSKTPKSLKRFSSSNRLEDFLNVNNDEDELDEFDRLVYTDTQNTRKSKTPDSNKLLIDNFSCGNDSVDEITYDDKTYLVRTTNVKQKPDYQRMDSPTRLRELYKYGLKPLKRKQAIIMLEYIYNQTHPSMLDDVSETNEGAENSNCNEKVHENESEEVIIESGSVSNKPNKYDLKDCSGSLLVIEDGLYPETESEEYIFQTNIKSKVSTALLPLHLAWFNLVRSSVKLRELILYYEPIDLQEIFIYFKSIGYRYDPKDLKRFFDARSIIFQYDLSKDGSNRHIRKSQKQKVRK